MTVIMNLTVEEARVKRCLLDRLMSHRSEALLVGTLVMTVPVTNKRQLERRAYRQFKEPIRPFPRFMCRG